MNRVRLNIFFGKVFHKRVFPKEHKFLYNYKSIYTKNIISFSNYKFYKQNDLFFKLNNCLPFFWFVTRVSVLLINPLPFLDTIKNS